jgi:hypothetical protein
LSQNGGLSALSPIGQTEKSRVDAGGQKFPGEKGSLIQCIVVMQQPILLLPKFGVKSSHIFIQSL